MRDLGQELGLQITIEDTWGGDIVSAASAHLAASTRERALLSVSFMNDWTNEHVTGYQPRSLNGFGSVPSGPGLGINVDASLLGRPVLSVGALAHGYAGRRRGTDPALGNAGHRA